MTSGLWTPPGSRAPRVTTVPDGHVKLASGRVLRLVHPGVPSVWIGPHALRVIATLDDTPHGELLHVSLSYPNRHPDWDTIRAVRDAFYPDTIDVMMVLPRAEDYVNVHPHTFHLWQTPTTWGLQ